LENENQIIIELFQIQSQYFLF